MLELLIKSPELVVLKLGARLSAVGTPVYISEEVEYVVWKRVHKCVDWKNEAKKLASSLGAENSAIFFTAVPLENIVLAEEGRFYGVATVGPRPLTCLDGGSYSGEMWGTINIFIATDIPLSRRGLLDLFRIVSETKAVVFSRHYPRCIGTVSDATAVAAPRGDLDYLGGLSYSARPVGKLVEKLIETGLKLWKDK